MVRPNLGSRTAKEQNFTAQTVNWTTVCSYHRSINGVRTVYARMYNGVKGLQSNDV